MRWTVTRLPRRGSRHRRFLDDDRGRRAADDASPARRTAASAPGRPRGPTAARTRPGRERPRAGRTAPRARSASRPARRSAGTSPNTTAAARPRMPASRSCVIMRSSRYGRSADVVEEQHVPGGRLERVRRPERRRQLRQRAAEQRAPTPRRRETTRGPARAAAPPARAVATHAQRTPRDRSPSAPRDSRPSIIGPWNATTPARGRQPDLQRRDVAVAEQHLRVRGGDRRVEQRQQVRRCRSRRARR